MKYLHGDYNTFFIGILFRAEKSMKPYLNVLLFLIVVGTVFFTLPSKFKEWMNIEQETFEIYHIKSQINNSASAKLTKNSACFGGVVFAQNKGGRLGNNLMEYASAWSLAVLYNVTPVVSDKIYNSIIPLFPKLSVPPISRFLNQLRDTDPDCAEHAERILLNGNSMEIQFAIEKQIPKMRSKGPIILKRFTVLVETISRLQTTLKKEFNYLPEFHSYAKLTLLKAAEGLDNYVTDGEIVYVGVHVRRTDYPAYLSRRFGLEDGKYVDINYYIRAMEYMLTYLEENGSLKVVFAVTSDDMKWTTNNLIPVLENHLRSRKILGRNATVSWCGSEDFRNDLVMLSACNHSIISYGTYGSWSSLMAGGQTVIFDLDPDGKHTIGSAMRFARVLSNWVPMH